MAEGPSKKTRHPRVSTGGSALRGSGWGPPARLQRRATPSPRAGPYAARWEPMRQRYGRTGRPILAAYRARTLDASQRLHQLRWPAARDRSTDISSRTLGSLHREHDRSPSLPVVTLSHLTLRSWHASPVTCGPSEREIPRSMGLRAMGVFGKNGSLRPVTLR